MIFQNQISPLSELQTLADSDRHSVLIEGPSGCGKSFLCNEYGKMLNVTDIVQIEPTVSSVRDAIDVVSNIESNVLIEISNLDRGVPGAAYTVLKVLEEPKPNLYIVVTCRNIQQVPDTIVSRSAVVSVGPPIMSDITSFAKMRNELKYSQYKNSELFSIARSYSDVDAILNMTIDQVNYYSEIPKMISSKDSVSGMMWALSHYKDDSESQLELVVRCTLNSVSDRYIKQACLSALDDIVQNKVAGHAVLSKLVFELKYGG